VSKRTAAIQNLEGERKSKIICYLTGDRPQFPTQVNEEIIPILLRHLDLIGPQENIDLLLYTRGGDGVVPVRIVKLIRNYCKKFSVIVPYRCHSAGTLICLGADEIVMTKIAELTPVDPSAQNHPFNPKTPANPATPGMPAATLPVSVEDVSSYLLFAKEILKAKDSEVVDLYAKMTINNQLHPLALGNVYRAQKMGKYIARKLLDLHSKTNGGLSEKTIENIIKEITEIIAIHNYPLYLDEVQKLGLSAIPPKTKTEEDLIWNLFTLFSEEMKLNVPFSPLDELGANAMATGNCTAAIIESEKAQDIFDISYQVNKIPIPNQPVVNMALTKMEWKKVV
jgi:hypothetical protein